MRIGVSLFHPLPSREMEALPWVGHAENIGALTALMRQWFHKGEASQEDLRLLSAPTDCSAPRALSLKERFVIVPIPTSRAPEIFPRGKAVHKTNSSPCLPKGTDFLCKRAWKSSNLMFALKTVEIVEKSK